MQRSALLIAALLAAFTPPLFSATAPPTDSITWMQVNMPPYLIHDGPDANTGYGDLVAAILQEQLPEYTHYTMVTNVIRHFDRFKQGENVCSIGLYKTPERQEFMYFSIPSLLTMPAVLIVRKERLADFHRQQGRIRLEDVLGDENIIIGLSKDRSYGNSLDAVLKKYSNRKNLVTFNGQELSENFFKMLMRDRLDGLIGLPDEAMYQAEKLGIRDQIATLLIEENQQGYEGWLCAVGCSKTEWGRTVIEKINRILIEQRPTERYRKAYERWLDDNSRERYRTIYQQVFLNTTR